MLCTCPRGSIGVPWHLASSVNGMPLLWVPQAQIHSPFHERALFTRLLSPGAASCGGASCALSSRLYALHHADRLVLLRCVAPHLRTELQDLPGFAAQWQRAASLTLSVHATICIARQGALVYRSPRQTCIQQSISTRCRLPASMPFRHTAAPDLSRHNGPLLDSASLRMVPGMHRAMVCRRRED